MYLMTNSGVGRLKPEDMDPELITISDIALSLSQINRYNGHTDRQYTLAGHCCVMHDYVKEHVSADRNDLMWALMHEAPKVYLGDIPRPVKKMPEVAAVFRPLEAAVMKLVCEKWDMSINAPDYLEDLDRRIILDEQAHYFAGAEHTRESWDLPEEWEALGVHIPMRSPVMDKQSFMNRFKALQDPVLRYWST